MENRTTNIMARRKINGKRQFDLVKNMVVAWITKITLFNPYLYTHFGA
jgi:hypothetical protein